MKLQDVILKAMAKKISWLEAAEIIGVCDRTMRRWRERLEKDGYDGLADRRKGSSLLIWPPSISRQESHRDRSCCRATQLPPR
jgi:transposase